MRHIETFMQKDIYYQTGGLFNFVEYYWKRPESVLFVGPFKSRYETLTNIMENAVVFELDLAEYPNVVFFDFKSKQRIVVSPEATK